MSEKCRRWIAVTSLMTLILMPRLANAWHGPGHMATALIAYHDLWPAKAHKVADILRKHPDYAAWMAQKPAALEEDEYLFMRASTWPDDIRAATEPSHKYHMPTWHYVNKFYRLDGLDEPAPEPGMHISEAMEANTRILQTSNDPAERARAVCWIIHLIGDVEQPLHTSALVSMHFAKGDRGGNLFWVKSSEGPTNLHSFWDGLWDRETAVNKGAGRKLSELTAQDTDITQIEPVAKRAAERYSRKDLPELAVQDFAGWVDESFSLAKERVYLNGKLEGANAAATAPALPDNYELDAKTLGERRLALGGYRLADKLTKTLNL